MRPILLLSALVLALAPSVPAPLAAAPLTALDFMTSTVFFEDQSSFSGIGLRARIQPPTLIPALEVMPTFEYWRNSSKLDPYDIRASRNDATLGVDMRYNFSNERWRPYIGAGWGLHFLSSEVDAPLLGIENADNSVIKGGLAALGGVTFAITDRLDNFFELKYHHLSQYSQTKINWGLTYRP
jgi:hypothetical protein